ncbi:TPA: FUSC family protein [Burkholderia cenocepacia]|uniref:FUSC family protein n=1 Tax=Burkholderia sp. BCC0801 TaxID=2676291 RepID=UPI00158D7228|nr:FUSC family protein [Burkholderia sp. BCC0801]HEF5875069.1 FUSC family protein [Burkholderia cenocepacia]
MNGIADAGARTTSKLVVWLARVDPGAHRRIKGIRLVVVYALATAIGSWGGFARHAHTAASVATLAATFALWASVSDTRATRTESSRDLVVLCTAGALGALTFASFGPWLVEHSRAGAELILVTGAFCVGYSKRFGTVGAGIGSQLYIGQLAAYTMRIEPADTSTIALALLIAWVAAIVPRLLTPTEERAADRPALDAAAEHGGRAISPALAMGLQAASGALVVVLLNGAFGLTESVWAITACVYVVATSSTGTAERVRWRICGTLVGVPVALACLPLAEHLPLVAWAMAALAMVVYAMALPDRYDIACGASAFALIVTLAASGVHSIPVLAARAWETSIGGTLGLVCAKLIFPLKAGR